MMNKKGAFVGLMVFIAIIILGLALMPSIKTEVDRNRASGSLDCDNTSISTGTALTCLVADLYNPFFAATLLFAGASYFAYRWYRSGL